MKLPLLFGFLLIILGAFIIYKMKSRQFKRRNFAGIQIFKSYGHSIVMKLLEKFALYSGYMIILWGVMLLIYSAIQLFNVNNPIF